MRQVSKNLGQKLQQFKTFIITFWMRLTASATLRTDFRPTRAEKQLARMVTTGESCLVLLGFEG